MNRKYLICGIIICLMTSPLPAENLQVPDWLIGKLFSYFEDNFNINKSDIELKFLHVPNITLTADENIDCHIEPLKNQAQLGHQTLWIKFTENGCLIKRFSITLEAAINAKVVVSSNKILRGSNISPDDLVTKIIRIAYDHDSYYRDIDEIVGLMAKQVIRNDQILKRFMLTEPPDIKRGDKVIIQMRAGDIIVTANGQVKEDALIGEKVRVVCEETGKRLTGILKTPKIIEVNLN